MRSSRASPRGTPRRSAGKSRVWTSTKSCDGWWRGSAAPARWPSRPRSKRACRSPSTTARSATLRSSSRRSAPSPRSSSLGCSTPAFPRRIPSTGATRTASLSSSASPPALTSAQVRELDRLASERFGIALDWLMEAAGWQAARMCIDHGRLGGDAVRELEALLKLGVEIGDQPSFAGADLVLDAVFGTGLNRAPEGRFAEWIEAINASGLRVVAVELPSGLDSDTGVAYSPCVRDDVTVTFTLPKAGLLTADGPRMAGDISVADIGIPNEALT